MGSDEGGSAEPDGRGDTSIDSLLLEESPAVSRRLR